MNLVSPVPSSGPGSQVRSEKAEAFRRRYREDLPQAASQWNPTLDLLLAHRSVRAYLPDALPEGTIETLVAAAQSAATSSNLQFWSVVAVEDRESKANLARLAGDQRHIVEAPLLLVWVADVARAHERGAARGLELEGLDFTEAFLVASVDATLAAQNAVVAAESLGLGTVYIGGLRNHPLDVAEALGLPPRSYAVFGLVVGRPDPARPAEVKPRLPQAAVLHRERYSIEAQGDAIERHDRHMLAFRAEQGLDAQSWSDLIVNRVRTVASLKGRHVLREVLGRLGFPLK